MTRDEPLSEPIELTVDSAEAGTRIDIFLAEKLPAYSRVQLRKLIHAGSVEVDGRPVKASFRLRPEHRVRVTALPVPQDGPRPENIPLDVLYEDEHLAAINKPPAMVVHPGKGHWKGTLTSALAYRFEQLSSVGGPTRPGVVHRLDRDTSGVIVVAKSDRAHMRLAAQFEARTVEKEYLAIVAGRLDRDRDVVDKPIGVHPYQREKMAIRDNHQTTRNASTFYEVMERFPTRGFAIVRVLPKTGRTHQIRVHLAHIGAPVLCDRLYGGRSQITRGELVGSDDSTVLLARQALHAYRLKLAHPQSGEPLELIAPLAADMQAVADELRRASSTT